MPRNMKSVSEKNTKNEILAAYQELLVEAQAGVVPSLGYQEEKAVVAAASSQTVEKITTDLSKLKLSFTQAVNEVADRLTQEAETLTTVQKAIVIAKKELEETQKIKLTAGLLYRLLETQKKQEDVWAQEEKMYAQETARKRVRDDEEYAYEKKLQKQRDTDERESEKLARERKTAEEAGAKTALVKELEELRKKMAQAPIEAEKMVKEVVGKALAEAKKDAEVILAQIKQQAENDMQMAGLKIESLEAINKTQVAEIAQLKKQLDEATRQVKDIAVSVISSNRSESSATS